MKMRVIIEQDEDGRFAATCPTLPGCISQGETRAEALARIQDAIAGYVENLRAHADPVPPPISEEVVEVELGLDSRSSPGAKWSELSAESGTNWTDRLAITWSCATGTHPAAV